jgi:hypothetical protein
VFLIAACSVGNNELQLDFQIRITCGWLAGRTMRIGRSGGRGGAAGCFPSPCGADFFGGLCPRFFFESCLLFFFFESCLHHMALNAGSDDMATRTWGRIKLPSFGAGINPRMAMAITMRIKTWIIIFSQPRSHKGHCCKVHIIHI